MPSTNMPIVVSALTSTLSVRTPRIAGRASTPERPKVKPGTKPSSRETSTRPFSLIASAPNADTEIGTSCRFSSRRWAVTMISVMPLSSPAAGAAVCAEAIVGSADATRIAVLAIRLLRKMVMMFSLPAHVNLSPVASTRVRLRMQSFFAAKTRESSAFRANALSSLRNWFT